MRREMTERQWRWCMAIATVAVVLLFATVATAAKPEVDQQSIEASLTSITDPEGETQYNLNLDFSWRCEDSVEFEIWIQWYQGATFISREDVFDPAPAPPSHPEWAEFDDITEVHGYSPGRTGWVFIDVINSDTGQVTRSSRQIQLPGM